MDEGTRRSRYLKYRTRSGAVDYTSSTYGFKVHSCNLTILGYFIRHRHTCIHANQNNLDSTLTYTSRYVNPSLFFRNAIEITPYLMCCPNTLVFQSKHHVICRQGHAFLSGTRWATRIHYGGDVRATTLWGLIDLTLRGCTDFVMIWEVINLLLKYFAY